MKSSGLILQYANEPYCTPLVRPLVKLPVKANPSRLMNGPIWNGMIRVMQVQGDVSRFSVGSALGNRAFSLGVDEVGLVAFDPVASPYGWYVVKRVE